MTWHLNRIMWPVHNLGLGRRVGVWVQGCSLACPGCVSESLWPAGGGSDTDVRRLAEWVVGQPDVDGVTVTGGEPFEQYAPLVAFAAYAKRLRPGLHVQVYSGFYLREIERRHPDRAYARVLDVLVDGRYVRQLHEDRNVRGSANQTHYRFEDGAPVPFEPPSPASVSVGVAATGDVYLAGIPRAGDLAHITARLAEAGRPIAFE